MNQKTTPNWLRHKGYLHITPQLDVSRRKAELIAKVSSEKYVKTYGFYPLIHSSIKERKYKKINKNSRIRSHTKRTGNHVISTAKNRPLHYASHMDALIFGYYAALLQEKYENRMASLGDLSKCVIAYRKIPLDSKKNKSTAHFAKEVFDEIKSRDACCVLTFDIKSFFSSIDHKILEKAWADIISETILPPHHKNVFNATTNFSYILLDDLRLGKKNEGRKKGFDERRLAEIRQNGKFAFFNSPKEFRDAVKSKQLKLYKHPFRNKKMNNIPMGIPQGLPISAVLANLYLLNFDKEIFYEVVNLRGGFYRRYSDDILVICKEDEADDIKKIIDDGLARVNVDPSKDKTEQFIFKQSMLGNGKKVLLSHKRIDNHLIANVPLNYLGFEFYGYQTLIKSSNLAKFYRRMIYSVKSKAKRARIIASKINNEKPVIYRRQLYKLYTLQDLNKTKIHSTIKILVQTERGDFKFIVKKKKKLLRSNYISYVRRASDIMAEPKIQRQIRSHKRIFNEAVHRHLFK